MATKYVVLVDPGSGFKEVGSAETNTPKQAQEQVLTELKVQYESGKVVAVPARSWDPQPFKLVSKPKLELG
jgi:hypothetical protein